VKGTGIVEPTRALLPIATEGWPFILTPAALALVIYWLRWPKAALAMGLLALFMAYFFRDPERVPPPASDAILAPADGKVVEVIPFTEWQGPGGEPLTQVGIFLSPWDVHINRAPVAGTVEAVAYRPGTFQVAWAPAASLQNEQTLIHLRTAGGDLWMKQVAGVLARRIVTWVRPGDKVEAGERVGLIRFGSRTDLILPSRYAVRVRPGQRAVGGVTVVAVRE